MGKNQRYDYYYHDDTPNSEGELKKCSRCKGSGELLFQVCPTCKGTGWNRI